MDNIEKDFFRIITNQDFDALRSTESWMSEIERAQICARKYEEGLREAYEKAWFCPTGENGMNKNLDDYLKSKK
jgi:hypothetical protein